MGKAPFPGMPPNKHLVTRACTLGRRHADALTIPFLGHECKRAGKQRRQRQTPDARLPSGVVWLKITVGAPWPVRYVTVDTSGNFIVCGQSAWSAKHRRANKIQIQVSVHWMRPSPRPSPTVPLHGHMINDCHCSPANNSPLLCLVPA